MFKESVQQIESFVDINETEIAFSVAGIIIKILYQADVVQLSRLQISDIKKLIELVFKIDKSIVSQSQLLQVYEHALQVVSRYDGENKHILDKVREDLHNKLGELRSGDKKSAAHYESEVMSRMRPGDADEALVGLKDFLMGLILVEKRQNRHELDAQEERINNTMMKFYQNLCGFWFDKKRKELNEELTFGIKRGIDDFKVAFEDVKQEIEKLCKYHLYNDARNLLTYPVPSPNRASDYDITHLLTIINTINKRHLSVLKKEVKIRLPWQERRDKLKEIRQTARDQLLRNVDILTIQDDLVAGFVSILKNIMQFSEDLLGKFPEPVAFAAFGSLSRGDAAPLSDGELGAKVGKKSKNLYIILQDFLSIVKFEMEALGESEGSLMAGFHLDAFPRIQSTEALEAFGIETVQSYASWAVESFYEDNSRLRPLFIYGDESLYRECINSLYIDKEKVRNVFLQTIKTFKESSWQNKTTPKIIDIKKDFLLPLTLAITQLCWFYGVMGMETTHPVQLVQLLQERGHLDEAFVAKVKSTLKLLYRIRFERQLDLNFNEQTSRDSVIWQPEFQQILDDVVIPLQLLLTRLCMSVQRTISKDIHPEYYPNENGDRQGIIRYKEQWQQNVSSKLLSASIDHDLPKLKLKTLRSGEGYLSRSVVGQLIKKECIDNQGVLNSKLITGDLSARSGVEVPVKIDDVSFILRFHPKAASLEYSANLLIQLVIGRCSAFIDIAKLEVNGKSYLILISEDLKGERLSEVNDKRINEQSFAEMFFLNLMTTPAEFVLHQLLFTEAQVQTSQTYKLSSIVNSQPFYPSVINENGQYAVLMKSALFCFENMKDNVHQAVREMLVNLEPLQVLENWIDQLKIFNADLRKIFTEAELAEFFKDEMLKFLFKRIGITIDQVEPFVSPIPLREKFISELYLRFKRINEILQKTPEITYIELLKRVEPLLGNFYEMLLLRYPKVMERIAHGLEQPNRKSSSKDKRPSSVLETLKTLEGKAATVEEMSLRKVCTIDELKSELKLIHAQEEGFDKIRKELLEGKEQALQELDKLNIEGLKEKVLNHINWSQLKNSSDRFISALLKIILRISFRRLRLINCTFVTKEHLIKILKNSPNLDSLTLINLTQVKKMDLFKRLSKYTPLLNKIHLDNVKEVTFESRKALMFVELKELFVTNCPRLTTIKLKCEALNSLILPQQQVQKLEIKAPKLNSLDITGWKLANREAFISLINSLCCASIKHLSSDGLSQVEAGKWIAKCPQLAFLPQSIFDNALVTNILVRILENNEMELNLVGKKIGSLGIQIIAALLNSEICLLSINLSDCEIADTDIKILTNALIHNQKLTKLNLAKNHITNDGIKIIATSLLINRTIVELNLDKNPGLPTIEFTRLLNSNRERLSGLFQAVHQGNLSKVQLLAEREHVSIHVYNELGLSPLHIAADKGHVSIVEYLVRNGARILDKSPENKTPFEFALAKKNQVIVDYLKPFMPAEYQNMVEVISEPKAAERTALPTFASDAKPKDLKQIVSPVLATTMLPVASGALVAPHSTVKVDIPKPALSELSLGALQGFGTYGCVYQATYGSMTVAVKRLLNQHLRVRDIAFLEEESKRLFNLDSSYIVKILGLNVDKENFSIMLEYMPNGSLQQMLEKNSHLPLQVRYQYAVDVGEGLLYLHSQNVIHGDLTSYNVLIDENNKVKLSDYGFINIKATSAALSTSKEGSIRWIAPEIYNNVEVNMQSDVYSFGVIMWEVNACKLPIFVAPRELIPTLVIEGKRDEIPVSTPPSMAMLIGKCWELRREMRPTINEVVDELNQEKKTYRF